MNAGEATATPAERREIIRDSLAVTLAGQLCHVLGTLSSLALRRVLTPEVIGIWTALRVFLDNTSRTSLGIPMAAAREVPILLGQDRRAAARRVCDVAFSSNTVTSLLYGLVLLGVAAFWWVRRGGPLDIYWAGGMAVLAGLVVLKRYQDFFIAVLRARKEFRVSSRVTAAEAVATLGAVVVGAALWGFRGMVLGWVVVLAGNVVLLHRLSPLRFRPRWDRAIFLRLLRDGVPLLLGVLGLSVLQAVDRFLIVRRLPDAERSLGYYSVALLATAWPSDVAGRIGEVLIPRYQEAWGRSGDPSVVGRLCGRMTRLQALPLAVCFGALFLGGPPLLGWLLPRYRAGLPALNCLIPGVFFLELSLPERQYLLTINCMPRLLSALGLATAAALGLGSWSIGRGWGIAGVAAGMSLGYATLFVASGLLSGRSQGKPWGELMGGMLRTLGLPACLGLAAWVIRQRIAGGNEAWTAVGLRMAVFGLASTGALIWAMGWRQSRDGLAQLTAWVLTRVATKRIRRPTLPGLPNSGLRDAFARRVRCADHLFRRSLHGAEDRPHSGPSGLPASGVAKSRPRSSRASSGLAAQAGGGGLS